jgi:hemoglobin
VTTEGDDAGVTLYEAVGGLSFFERLVEAFYVRVQADPILIRLYPESELSGAKRRLATFLGQYWGGPPVYQEERGHPALKMRHFPYSIGPEERDHWMVAMRGAVEELDPIPQVKQMLMEYFTMAAEHLRNDRMPRPG